MGFRGWTIRNWATTLLVVAGAALIVVGVLDEHDSLGRIGIGAGLLLLGVFGDRLRRAKVGPTGAEIELEERAAESTSELTESSTAAESPDFPEPDQVVDAHRAALGWDVIRFLTRPEDGALAGCAFQLYLYDENEDMLLPTLEPAHADPSPTFRIGEGVAGTAWATGQLTLAEGPAVTDQSFLLSAEKRARYSDLAVVAAVPVTNAAGQVVAVLSASSTNPKSDLHTEAGFDALVARADAVARVLIDLFKWFGDDYHGE